VLPSEQAKGNLAVIPLKETKLKFKNQEAMDKNNQRFISPSYAVSIYTTLACETVHLKAAKMDIQHKI
jgi:hypothetical protein